MFQESKYLTQKEIGELEKKAENRGAEFLRAEFRDRMKVKMHECIDEIFAGDGDEITEQENLAMISGLISADHMLFDALFAVLGVKLA